MFFFKRTRAHSNENGNGRFVSLMLADNDPRTCQMTEALLCTYRRNKIVLIGSAPSGEDFLIQAQTLAPQVALIDLHLPELGGLWTIPLLRVVFPETRIIVLASEDVTEPRSAILAAGADEIVAKATMKTDLIPAIERVLDIGDATSVAFQRNPSLTTRIYSKVTCD